MTTIATLIRGVRQSVPALAFVVATGACATQTSTTAEWSSQVPASGPLKSVVVFGAGVDPTQRRVLEDQLSTSLSQHGVAAKPSYALFADSVPDRDAARATLQSGGYDGALVARLKRIHETPHYVPEAGLWGGYYGGAGWGYDAGYVTTDTNVDFEVTLWQTEGKGKMLWSSTTTTLNPTGSKDFAVSLANNVIPNLTKSGFLPP